MADELQDLMAEVASRMQELGTEDANDPRLAPLLARVNASAQTIFSRMMWNSPIGKIAAVAPEEQDFEEETEGGLPPPLRDLLRGYSAFARSQVPSAFPGVLGVSTFLNAVALTTCEPGKQLLALSPAEKALVSVYAYVAWVDQKRGYDGAALRRVVSDLLRTKLDLSDEQAIALVKAATREGFGYASFSPNQTVATTLKRHVETHGLARDLRAALQALRIRMSHGSAENNAQGRKLLSIVEAMLAHDGLAAGAEPRFKAKPDAWGKALDVKLASLPFETRAHLTSLLTLAAKGGENAKPAKGWLKTAEKELDRVGRARIGPLLMDVIECHEPGATLALENQNTLRALIWLAAMAAPDVAGRRLEAYAQTCLTFSAAHFAYLSLVLGNATVHAFSLMPGTAGVGSLSRLKRRLKRPGEIKTVDKAIAALAQARGMSAGELEEIGLPDYGFSKDGRLAVAIGPATAELTITDDCTVELNWLGSDGRSLGGPSAAVRDGHAAELKSLKARVKEVGETLKAQRLRLERLYLDNRVWPFDVWRARYLDEPLVSRLARRLIWSFKIGETWVAGLLDGNDVLDAAGGRLSLDPASTRVRLWHPMQADVPTVLALRRAVLSRCITQPFKQAHREIYVLTDAERNTAVYSNRFAAHIVEQHKFRALCQARGWNCPAFGGWDPGDARPLKRLADREIQIEFWVEPIEESMNDNYQFQHLSTDQVRFVTMGGEPIPLENVDRVLFSELMRDVDLFVGVAGIGNDPAWADRGDDNFGGYWGRAAFGELTETGKTRHAVLKDLVPGLTIAPRCRLEERNLVVEGKLRTYRIHLGSGNIQMEPNSQYLCIVQDRQSKSGQTQVRLPFEGDTTLSIILSKAFMLAEDDMIKDASIRSQIRSGLPGI